MSAFAKEFMRTIVRKPGRFLALLAIVALGAGFYAGLRSTAPDMDIALDRYLDITHGYDIRVVSTMGLEEADMDAIAALEGVEAVMPAFQADVLAQFERESFTTRVHSLPPAALASTKRADGGVDSDDPAYLNRLILEEGRFPERVGECVISKDRVLSQGVEIGDHIVFTQGTTDLADTFDTRTFEVVGKVRMPYYVSSAAIDSSSLGSGVVQQVLYVSEDSFAEDMPFADAFVAVEGSREHEYGTEAYDACIAPVKERIEGIADERCQARLDSLTEDMYDSMTTYSGMLTLLEYRLSHTKAEFDDPEKPEWLVMDRSKNPGIASFSSDADRVDHIASVFPFMFFVVAALVALTTMTRMVDEERQLIGTYLALGYSKARIVGKYMAYVMLAGVVGSAIGIGSLSVVLPAIIMYAYSIMYAVPPAAFPLHPDLVALSAGMAIGITLIATVGSAATTLREKPAALMLPRAPKSGKRIVLERIGPLWRRMSFTWKVTFRNLLRYKKRLFMTVVGIAGCSALLLTGLGLRDSISDIMNIQYDEIIRYNAVISFEDDATDEQRDRFEAVLADAGALVSGTYAASETMLASGPDASDKRIDLVVPQDPDAFEGMRVLRDRTSHEPLHIEGDGALLNEKMAQELGLGVGDTIVLHRQDAMGNATSKTYEFTIRALFENYIYNYIIVTPQAFAQEAGRDARLNTLYGTIDAHGDDRVHLNEALDETGIVKTVTYNDDSIESYRTMLRSVDMVVVVLVVAAAMLAFIVLYNLTNINIEERIREIATLKVLGFTHHETNAYIFREIVLLTIIGALCGLVLGIYMESFVVLSAEVDQIMFGRTIHPPSFILAFLLTIAFGWLSMAMMIPKLAHVDMVESLKSVE